MSNIASITDAITFDQVLVLAQQLRPIDQVRLVARLAPKVEWIVQQVEAATPPLPRKPLRGLLADLRPTPLAEDIDEVQREMWATFAEEWALWQK